MSAPSVPKGVFLPTTQEILRECGPLRFADLYQRLTARFPGFHPSSLTTLLNRHVERGTIGRSAYGGTAYWYFVHESRR